MIDVCLPDIVLFELRCRILAPIRNLPHYHGAHWSALFRNALKAYLPVGMNMAAAGISVISVEAGITAYEKGEPAHVGLTFPACLLVDICRMLIDFNNLKIGEGHFQPGKTVLLENVHNRISGDLHSLSDLSEIAMPTAKDVSCALNNDAVAAEISCLSQLAQFSILFYTPLRLPRPAGEKKKQHRFCDEDYFTAAARENSKQIDHLVKKIRIPTEAADLNTNLLITDSALTWIDIPYGYGIAKTLGGIVGKIKLAGLPSADVARRLVVGQYTGAGKNPAFGLGFYSIPELNNIRKIKLPTRGKSMLQRALAPESMKSALYKTTTSSPGPDGLTFSDIKKAGNKYLESLGSAVVMGQYKAGSVKKYRLPKPDGGFREIQIQNAVDRLLQKAIADFITPSIDRLLSASSFAYRMGLNRKGAASALKKHLAEGFTSGIKTDIAGFFDSVKLNLLSDLLSGLFPFDDLPDSVIPWLAATDEIDAIGLPQGSPLSPVFSNLYLHQFDRDMTNEGFKLIRYADDFVCLFSNDASVDQDMDKIKTSLSRLGLAMKPEKTIPVRPGTPIKFLGYIVTAGDIAEERKEDIPEEELWTPLFRDQWLSGAPVYLSSICRGAYSSGPDLIIKDDRNNSSNVPWNQISRITIIGRSSFSGGVVYRAAREKIPVNFIDIMGRAVGNLHPAGYEMPEMSPVQEPCSKDSTFCLAFAREIISAKIMNSHVLLRRNNVESDALKEMIKKAQEAESMDTLRGYEGYAAKVYFGELAGMVAPFDFKGRIYHPPDGPVNVMLSFGYTLLYNRISLVLRDKGFNPRIGFFHKGRGGHLSLASDLLEELRHIIERIVLALIHCGEIKQYDFNLVEKRGIQYSRLEGDGFRKYIHRFEHTMAANFTSEGGEKFTYNSYLDEMADNLKRALKLDIPYRALRID